MLPVLVKAAATSAVKRQAKKRLGRWLRRLGLLLVLVVGGCAVIMSGSASPPGQQPTPAAAAVPVPSVDENAIPAEYRDMFFAAARRCPQVPLAVFAAQVWQESRWNPDAVSPVGAGGLVQFMPGTWDAYGVDANGDGVANRFDPEDNLHSSAEYNCALLETLADVPGDPIRNMLAGYNAGPGRVEQYGGVPPCSFANCETFNYVNHIMEKAAEWTVQEPPPVLDTVSQAGPAPPPPAGGGGWTKPTDGPVTSGFGMRWGSMHNGTDIGAACDTRIVAAEGGLVVRAGRSSGYGNLIVIDHGDGVVTRYAHMYDGGVQVAVDQTVVAGEQIGLVGSFGQSTGCHLHFEVLLGGSYTSGFVDPEPFMRERGAPL